MTLGLGYNLPLTNVPQMDSTHEEVTTWHLFNHPPMRVWVNFLPYMVREREKGKEREGHRP